MDDDCIKRIEELEKRNTELEEKLKALQRIITMYSNCYKIKDKNNNWIAPADYLKNKYGIECSHSICPDCVKKLYPDLNL